MSDPRSESREESRSAQDLTDRQTSGVKVYDKPQGMGGGTATAVVVLAVIIILVILLLVFIF